ncbi:hypothetical protein Tco_1571360 [Tanacetum coccineum]
MFLSSNSFGKIATARTLDNGEIELTATIDGKVKIVTKASIRRHLQLADSDGISSLPTTEIFEQLSLMCNMKRASKGYTGKNIPLFPAMIVQAPVVQGEGSTHLVESHHTPTGAPSTLQPLISPTSRRTNRQESVVPQPRSPTQSLVADEAASTGVDVRYRWATTTVTGLKAGQGSGNIDKTPTMPYDSPLLRKVESLETDLKQTKLTYGAAYTKLIKKVKKLENKVKSNQARRRARIIGSDDEDDLESPKSTHNISMAEGKQVPVAEGSSETTTVSHLTGIDNDIYSTLCLSRMHCDVGKAIERFETRSMSSLYFNYTRHNGKGVRAEEDCLLSQALMDILKLPPEELITYQNHPTQTLNIPPQDAKSHKKQRKAIVTLSAPTYDPELLRISVVCKSLGFSAYKLAKAYGRIVSRECQNQKTSKGCSSIHKEKMILYKQEELEDEFTDLQCDYGETLEKCERLEKELSKSRTMSKSFESL